SKEYVCRDGQFITGRGMGVSTEFGLALAAALVSPEKAEEIKASIQKP
ncbi:MAG: DJ-1 family protein, partial [Acutalibacter sp.]|nr:DJ-1 family protein [Acutalibacter sp.]